MDRKAQLGEFLRSRRSQLKPEDVGVRRFDERRRVAGLRREELALLASRSGAICTTWPARAGLRRGLGAPRRSG